MSPLVTRTITVLAGLSLTAAACSSGGADAATTETGVASLADTDAAADADSDDVELDADEAALAFSACMRDEGLDFPDIGVDADGNLNLRDAFEQAELDPGSPDFRAGMEVCGDLIADAGFGGGGGRAALTEDPEIQDALVAFSDCLRDAGYDVGDLTLGGPGEGGPGEPAEAGSGEGAEGESGEPPVRGERPDGFGDPNARFAEQLGLDFDDPAVAADLEACSPIIDAAFSAAGIGQGGAGGQP